MLFEIHDHAVLTTVVTDTTYESLLSCIPVIILQSYSQGGHGTGKTGNLVLTFSRQGKHRKFCCNTGKIFETQGKYF